MRIDELDPRITEAMLHGAAWNHPPLEAREVQADLDRFQRLMEDPDA